MRGLKANSNVYGEYQNFLRHFESYQVKERATWCQPNMTLIAYKRQSKPKGQKRGRQRNFTSQENGGNLEIKKFSTIKNKSKLKCYNYNKNDRFAWEFLKSKKVYSHPTSLIASVPSKVLVAHTLH